MPLRSIAPTLRIALVWVLYAALGVAGRGLAAPPAGFTELLLPQTAPPQHAVQVLDGDTFEADLDGDGRLDLPRERVRLLYVDTPELSESHKGQDRAHGLPARAFLQGWVGRGPWVLWIPADRPTGNYGRTLAELRVGAASVNLALIRAGHSYFDTRFRFPPGAAEYAAYAAAEAEAFTARRGIWGDAASRRRYLGRLQREHKTPAAPDNPRFLAGVQDVTRLNAAGALGRYAVVQGVVEGVRTLGKGVRRVTLRRGAGAPLPVVAFRGTAERLAVDGWQPGRAVRVEGFLQTYRGQPELRLHYGAPLP